MDEKRKKIVDRVIKLMKLAGELGSNSNTTEAEMMSAMTKAKALMTEHNIAEADLLGVTDAASAQRIVWDVQMHTAYTRKIRDLAEYDRVVAAAVEHLFDVKSLYYSGRHTGYATMKFVGEITDAQIAAEVFHIILTHVRRATRQRYGSATWGKSHTSYAVGYAMRLRARAEELARAAQPQTTTALVLASKALAVNKWVTDNITWDTSKRRDKTYDRDAMHAGYRDGERFDISGFAKSIRTGETGIGRPDPEDE